MAKRRRVAPTDVPVMPRELLEPGNRAVRQDWFAQYGLTTGPQQAAALDRACKAYDIPDPRDLPDPRELMRGLTNDAAPIRPRRGHPASKEN